MFILVISFDHFQFTLICGLNIPGCYAILFFTASDFTSIISHIPNWAFFSLWLFLFILSFLFFSFFFCFCEVWSFILFYFFYLQFFSISILGTYQLEEVKCHIFLPFHTVHGVLKERMLKWFAIPFSSGPHFIRPLHHDPSV